MEILFEDNHLIAVNKPFCVPSQGDESMDESVVDWTKSYIKHTYNKPGNVYLGLLHRLDRPAGGVLLMAKTSKAATRLSRQFQQRSPAKSYLAICRGIPQKPVDSLTHYLKQIPGKNIMRAYPKQIPDSKKAQLSYRLIAQEKAYSLLAVKLETGRKHQIRVQLASLKTPIVGDVKYGDKTFNSDKSICLLAHQLEVEHPTLKKPIVITAPFPSKGIWESFQGKV